jgi:hypothetical protein
MAWSWVLSLTIYFSRIIQPPVYSGKLINYLAFLRLFSQVIDILPPFALDKEDCELNSDFPEMGLI